MANVQTYLNTLLFAVLPYVALAIFFLKTIERYRLRSFSYTSLSSQFLENQHHFWAVMPFHLGVLVVLTGHVVAFLMPRSLLWWNQVPARLYVLELTALVFGMLTLIGLAGVVIRRLVHSKVRCVTSRTDWVVYALLVIQVVSGVAVAVFHPWGSSWFSSAMTPYLWSIVKLNPDVAAVSAVPLLVKIHLLTLWLVLGIFPFSRLVHILVIPNNYLWRKTQVVRWYRRAA